LWCHAAVTNAPRLIALRPLRHACYQCGTCCQGWRVHLTEAERERVLRQAVELEVVNPVLEHVVEGDDNNTPRFMLRTDKGRCVFLSEDNLCRIHGTFGADEKPLVCRQFPRRVTQAEDGLRLGIDPACTSTYRSWENGPEVEPLLGMQSTVILGPELIASEQGLLALLSQPDMTIARFVAIITGAPPHLTELPVGFVGRVIACLRIADLAPFFKDPGAGRDVLYRISHLPEFLRTLSPTEPPPWQGRLTPALDAFAREVMRRHLFMRLGDPELPPMAQALLMLTGVLVCGWADANEESFPEALAAWVRLVRIRGFWSRYLPETATARWLMLGDGEPPQAPDDAAEVTAPEEP